jgi:protein-disulfide isomerase
MSKTFWGIIIAITVALVGVGVLTSDKSSAPSGNQKGNASKLTQHVVGQGKAGVTLIEYADYQCPYCQQYEPTLKQVVEKFESDIKFQYRNFPLMSQHQNAFAAARAAEAADLQGKFWEMHDLLLQNNDPSGRSGWVASNNPNPFFEGFAKQIKLDMDKYKQDFASSLVNDRVNADLAEGNKLGITGTPTFYLNGKKVEIPNDLAAFEKVIKAEIAKQSKKKSD